MTAATGDRSPAITVDRLTKRYGYRPVVEGLSFSIPMCVVTGFLGPNGSGKNTTIRAIFGLIHPTYGTTLVHGGPFAELDQPARHAGLLIDGVGRTRSAARVTTCASSPPSGVAPSRVDDVLDLVELTRDTDLAAVDVVHPLRQPSTRR